MTDAILDDWSCPAWLAVYSRDELRRLAYNLDQRNRQQRIVINQLREQLDRRDRQEDCR